MGASCSVGVVERDRGVTIFDLKRKKCLVFYDFQFGLIYDAEHLVYNVHSPIHLANDCIYFKCSLNELALFPFEPCLEK
jgi:hypothetical protein